VRDNCAMVRVRIAAAAIAVANVAVGVQSRMEWLPQQRAVASDRLSVGLAYCLQHMMTTATLCRTRFSMRNSCWRECAEQRMSQRIEGGWDGADAVHLPQHARACAPAAALTRWLASRCQAP
jgi:hypothetical protein